MSNQLSIIVLGASHGNFVLPFVLSKIFKQLASRSIPCSFMQEAPSDETFKTAIESTMRGLQQDRLIKQLAPEINDFYVKDAKSLYPYLLKSAWGPLEQIVKEKFMPLLGKEQHNEAMLQQIVLELYRENAYIEEIKLYQNLEQLKVHFAGIDAEASTYREQLMASSSSADAYYHNESTRINTMVSNVFQHIKRNFLAGGIVLVSTGTNHAQRLAANLLQYSRTDQFDSTNLDINVCVFKVRSYYEKDWSIDHQAALELTAPLDSTEIKDIYKSLPCKEIVCQEEGAAVSLPELESMVNEWTQRYIQRVTSSPATSRSIFSPLSVHDQLVDEIRNNSTKTSLKTNDKFMAAIEKKDYSLALRFACGLGDCALIKLLLKYSEQLPIDCHATSSNGNTPLAWFEASGASRDDKIEIRAILEKKMELSAPAPKQSV